MDFAEQFSWSIQSHPSQPAVILYDLADRASLFRTVGATGELEFFHDEVGKVIRGKLHLFGKVMILTPIE